MFNRELTFLFLFGSFLVSSTQTTNVALNKMAYQRSNLGFAGRAVDGDVSSCTQTAAETNPWWYVDLGNVYSIEYLLIYRTGLSLMDVVVRVSDSSSTVLSTDDICGIISSETPITASGEKFFLECNPFLSGRYVSLHRSSSTAIVLKLCHVQVFVPVIECPDDIIIAGTTSSNSVVAVFWDSPVVADDSPSSCVPSSGSMFTLSHTVSVTCTTFGVSGSCQFNVQVIEECLCNSSGSAYNVAVTIILCLIIVVISTLLIVYCRSYYSLMKRMKKLQKGNMDYEVAMETTGNTQGGREYEVNIPSVANPKVPPMTSEQDNSGYEELHAYMSVDHPYADLKK